MRISDWSSDVCSSDLETMMATTATETAEQDLKLTPPEPVPVVAPEKAVGLVPVDDATNTKLEERVDAFVPDLVAQAANSPEFGPRVDPLRAIAQPEHRGAAGQSTAFPHGQAPRGERWVRYA